MSPHSAHSKHRIAGHGPTWKFWVSDINPSSPWTRRAAPSKADMLSEFRTVIQDRYGMPGKTDEIYARVAHAFGLRLQLLSPAGHRSSSFEYSDLLNDSE